MSSTKKTRSEQKHEDILAGAKQAFLLYGVGNTSMDKIAELARVSKRTVYNHFASKEILVTRIVKEAWRSTILEFETAYDNTRALKPQLLALVHNQLSLMTQTDMLDLVRVAVAHCLYNSDNFQAEIAGFFEQETAMIRWLKHAMEDKKLKKSDPIIANEHILNLLKGRALWPQLLHSAPVPTPEEQNALAEETVDFFLSYYQA